MERLTSLQRATRTLFLIVSVLLTISANAFDLISDIHTDYLTYQSEQKGMCDIEVYAEFCNSDIQFISDGDIFKANVEVNAILLNATGEVIDQQFKRQKLVCSDFKATLDVNRLHIIRFYFTAAPGPYTASLTIRDVESHQEKHEQVQVTANDYNSRQIALSMLKLSDTPSLKSDNSVPNISHIFSNRHYLVHLYYEGYYQITDETPATVLTEYALINAHGKNMHQHNEKITVHSKKQGYSIKFSVAGLPPGEYTFSVKQMNTATGIKAQSETHFRVLQSPIDLRFKSFSQVLDEIRLLATDDELAELEDLPSADRQNGIERFWENHDPNPDTEINELMVEYYRRINIANKAFSSIAGAGLHSDPGVIYIMFGKPDGIVTFPASDGINARQIWKYKKLDITFIFDAPRNQPVFHLRDRNYVFAKYIDK